MSRSHVQGTIYLLHFDEPYHHARHYIGWTENDLAGRLDYHQRGQGSRLLRAVAQAGIGWTVARTWDGDRFFERWLKKQRNAKEFCPVCSKRPREPGYVPDPLAIAQHYEQFPDDEPF